MNGASSLQICVGAIPVCSLTSLEHGPPDVSSKRQRSTEQGVLPPISSVLADANSLLAYGAYFANRVLSARRNEDDGCQIVEAAVMRRALSTRSGAGQTYVGAASPRKAGQQHDNATGGEALE